MTRLRYWLYVADEFAMRLLIGEDVLDRVIREHHERADPPESAQR